MFYSFPHKLLSMSRPAPCMAALLQSAYGRYAWGINASHLPFTGSISIAGVAHYTCECWYFCLPHWVLLFLHVYIDLRLSLCMREQKSLCKFLCTHVCTSICFPVTINILWECVCVCVILPLKIINTGVAPGRPAAYSAWLSTMLQKWLHFLIHPSLPSSIRLSVLLCLKKGHHGLSSRQQSDQTKPETSHTTTPQKKNLLSLLLFINLSISLSYTIFVSPFQHYCNGSHTVRYELKDTHTQHINTQAKTHTYPGMCAQYIQPHMVTHAQPNQASVPRSLMFVKVINFLCEIRGHGGRTEGDGCQPQNLSLLSSTDTGALWVHSTGPLHGHRGYPRIPRALTNKGFEWGKRRKRQMKGNAKKEIKRKRWRGCERDDTER